MSRTLQNSPRRISGLGGNRRRSSQIRGAIERLEFLTSKLDAFEVGILEAVNERPDAITVRGQPDDPDQHATAIGEPALTALADYDDLVASIGDMTISAIRMHERWAATRLPNEPPEWACEAMWPIPLEAVHTGHVGRRLERPYRLSRQAYEFVRTRRRLPRSDEVEAWEANGRSWRGVGIPKRP